MDPNTNPNFQQQNPYSQTPNYSIQEDLPSASLIQWFGILSVTIVLGLIGYIFGLIALSKGNAAIRMYNANPQAYTQSSYQSVKIGRTCALIGIIIYSIVLLLILVIIIILLIMGNMAWNPVTSPH